MLRSTCLTLALAIASCDRPTPPPAAEPTSQSTVPDAAATAPAPVAPAPDAPSTERPTAGELHYVERILGDAKPDDPLPIIVAIHGLGDDPDNFAHLFDAFPETARLILPQGVDEVEAGGWSWFPIRARSNDVDGLSAGIASSAEKLAVAIETLRAQRPTLGEPIVTGFSQGGMLTFTLAVHHPEQVGYAVPIGGWLPPPLWPETGPTSAHSKIVALHGTADTAVPFEPTKDAVDALRAKGYDTTLKSYEGVPHAIPPRERTDLYDLLSDALTEARRAAKGATP